MNRKWLLSLSLVLLLVVAAACSGEDEAGKNNGDNKPQGEAPAGNNEATQEVTEPDLEGIPDVVAEVNGQEISKEDFEATYMGQFQQMATQAQMTGEKVDQDQLKKQVVDAMVGQELLSQEAENAGYEVSEKEINEELENLAKQNGLESKDKFIEALSEQGMPEEEVMSVLESEIKIDQLITDKAGDVEPTEEELKGMYDQLVAMQEQNGGENGQEVEIPSFEEIKPRLKEQVESQKRTEAMQTLVKDLRESADITINI